MRESTLPRHSRPEVILSRHAINSPIAVGYAHDHQDTRETPSSLQGHGWQDSAPDQGPLRARGDRLRHRAAGYPGSTGIRSSAGGYRTHRVGRAGHARRLVHRIRR